MVTEQAAELRRYGRYEVLFSIASGGMAEVFAARMTGEAGFARLVALKRMHRHLASEPAFVDMFLDEARLAATISSPHVVPTVDLGRTDDGELYIVMELVIGASLSQLLSVAKKGGRRIPVDMAAEILAQSAIGLHAAHEARSVDGTALDIVHRDVSPQNILVGVDGHARITDFGVARAVQRISATTEGQVKGKFAYCSPEQAQAEHLDRRSDLFSLGVVAWEMLTGRRLFHTANPLRTLSDIVSTPSPAVNDIHPELPEPLARAVARALEKRAEDRFATASAMAEALREAVGHSPVSAKQLGSFVQAAGGETVEQLQSRIHSAVSGTRSREAVVEPTGTVVKAKAAGHPLLAGLPDPRGAAGELTATSPAAGTQPAGVAALPLYATAATRIETPAGVEESTVEEGTDFAATHAADQPAIAGAKGGRRQWMIAAAAALLLSGAAATAWVSSRQPQSPQAQPAAAPSLPSAAVTSALPTASSEPALTPVASSLAAASASASAPKTVFVPRPQVTPRPTPPRSSATPPSATAAAESLTGKHLDRPGDRPPD